MHILPTHLPFHVLQHMTMKFFSLLHDDCTAMLSFLSMLLPSVKLLTFEPWRVDHPSKSQRLILGFQLSRFWCQIRAFASFNLYPDNSIVWSSCWQRNEIFKSSSAQYLRLYCQFWFVSKRFRSTLCLCPLHIPRVDP